MSKIDILDDLAQLIEHERDALLAVWRMQVRALPAARDLDVPTLNDHIPHLLAELAGALRAGSGETIAQALLDGSPPAHGLQRVKDAFDIEEGVAEYNIARLYPRPGRPERLERAGKTVPCPQPCPGWSDRVGRAVVR